MLGIYTLQVFGTGISNPCVHITRNSHRRVPMKLNLFVGE
jgi:hypothetical protein